MLFSGHADVAPFEPDDWKICRPYQPVIKDGRLYGRGAADMKGGLAAAFWAHSGSNRRPSGRIWTYRGVFESYVTQDTLQRPTAPESLPYTTKRAIIKIEKGGIGNQPETLNFSARLGPAKDKLGEFQEVRGTGPKPVKLLTAPAS